MVKDFIKINTRFSHTFLKIFVLLKSFKNLQVDLHVPCFNLGHPVSAFIVEQDHTTYIEIQSFYSDEFSERWNLS